MKETKNAEELYQELAADSVRYSRIALNEDMYRYYLPHSQVYYLVNEAAGKAWELVDGLGRLPLWTRDDVDYDSFTDEEHTQNAWRMMAPYHFGVGDFRKGRAVVSWMLHPEGRYYADEDGYGGSDDDEVVIYGVVDRDCRLYMPFSMVDYGFARRVSSGEEPVPERRTQPAPCPAPPPAAQPCPDPLPVGRTYYAIRERSLWERIKEGLWELLT